MTSWGGILKDIAISIHALREEGDCLLTVDTVFAAYFYPRPPRGGRQLRQNPKSGKP